MPNDLGRCSLVSADFWTSDRLSERSRRVYGGTITFSASSNHPFPAQATAARSTSTSTARSRASAATTRGRPASTSPTSSSRRRRRRPRPSDFRSTRCPATPTTRGRSSTRSTARRRSGSAWSAGRRRGASTTRGSRPRFNLSHRSYASCVEAISDRARLPRFRFPAALPVKTKGLCQQCAHA